MFAVDVLYGTVGGSVALGSMVELTIVVVDEAGGELAWVQGSLKPDILAHVAKPSVWIPSAVLDLAEQKSLCHIPHHNRNRLRVRNKFLSRRSLSPPRSMTGRSWDLKQNVLPAPPHWIESGLYVSAQLMSCRSI